MVQKFRKKPVVIEALQWTGENIEEIKDFAGGGAVIHKIFEGTGPEYFLQIITLEGVMEASHGDFIIKGVNGEFYPCKPDIFEKTYELVNEE